VHVQSTAADDLRMKRRRCRLFQLDDVVLRSQLYEPLFEGRTHEAATRVTQSPQLSCHSPCRSDFYEFDRDVRGRRGMIPLRIPRCQHVYVDAV
jgi:hypothetical protein